MTARAAQDPYLAALLRIPAGQTRTFSELAELAGRPGAARAAGRAVRALRARRGVPWHRVVPAIGILAAGDPDAAGQIARLQLEGARPRAGESPAAWAARRGLAWVGLHGLRRFAAAEDPRVAPWDPLRVEGFAGEDEARARGFVHLDAPDPRRPPLPQVDPGALRAARAAGKSMPPLAQRLADRLPDDVRATLEEGGPIWLPGLLSPAECLELLDRLGNPAAIDRTVTMGRHGFGAGEYHYLREPMPDPAAELRERLYQHLRRADHPPDLDGFFAACRAAGQERPSSILLCYGEGGINHPHRDLYGPVAFPWQALVLLVRRGTDFEGGEFALFDAAGGPQPIPADQGDVVLFDTRRRHGMLRVTRGRRYALGLVFHLAR